MKKLSKQAIEEVVHNHFSEMAKKRHKKMTKEERSKHGLKMYLGTKRAKERENKGN